MISRSLTAHITKTHLSAFQSPSLYQNLILQSTSSIHSHSLSSPSPSQDSDYPQTLNQKDWLSPNEVVKIFQTLKNPNSALSVFTQISNRKDYKPNEALYSAVITKLALAKNFDAIDVVLARIKSEKGLCRISETLFYNVIKIYGNVAGRVDRAIETLFDMPNYGCWPTVKTFNFVLNLVVNSKRFDVVHEVYLGGCKLGIEIDACCLNIMIKGLCWRGDFDAAFKVLDEFPKQKCKPNVRTYSILMHGLCDRGKVEEAFGLLERMERENIEPDTITFNILISGLRKQGRVDEGIELSHKMRLKGCGPNQATYQEVLYGLIDANKSVEAKDFMSRMISEGVSPSFDSFKSIIKGLCKKNLMEDVDWVLKQMVRHGFVPRKGMWKKIIRCLFSGHGSYACFSFTEFLEN
ncbi:hypothetical protein RHMOL_Rhmol04G0054200 [Rhododendron molle]|uniref:Uncharacterized protein n=1 Tax=Rhododendron molle TaxID=49168 RepID=A0ACC0NXD5_RHOML|nr:hypothetical protein RHMOL_Rhmol04G0054200 [Rhododendron molle]